jgi:hypothetical protein
MGAPARKLPLDLKSLCRAYTESNVRILGGWALDEEAAPDIRIQAIKILLDRGWGPVRVPHDLSEDGLAGFEIVVRRIIEEKRIRVIEGTSNGQAHIEGSSENQDQ